jgi:predicted CoA-substrate-specific enzyme activase
MPQNSTKVAAGVDIGSECVKAVVVGDGGRVLGRAVAPARGYFQTCAHQALASACEDAQTDLQQLAGIGATGFAMDCFPTATLRVGDAACHALGAFQHVPEPMTLVDIGGRDPHVILVDDLGRRTDARGVRRCALGIGSFLMFAARHLDVPPTRLQELAAAAERPVPVSSYCSVFSAGEVLERLREGATREEIALGCMQSIAERIVEIGGFRDQVLVCGGVVDFFPGVLRAMESLAGVPVRAVPDPMYTAAVGAALMTLRNEPVS